MSSMFRPSSFGLSAAPRGKDNAFIDLLPKPWLIVACLLTSVLLNRLPGLGMVGIVLAALARRMMVIGLFLLGAVLTREVVRNIGLRPILLAAFLMIAPSGPTLISFVSSWI